MLKYLSFSMYDRDRLLQLHHQGEGVQVKLVKGKIEKVAKERTILQPIMEEKHQLSNKHIVIICILLAMVQIILLPVLEQQRYVVGISIHP